MFSYLDSEAIARAQALGLKARHVVEGVRVGDHRSPFRGFSVEFVQHREYVPGDDTRHIDWKSYGRSERYIIKQYEQDTNFLGHILLDSSRSMLYGDGATNKLAYAKFLSACLSYLIIQQGDSVGLNIFDAGWRFRLPPRGQPGHWQSILYALEATMPEEKTSIGPLLDEMANETKRRGLVFLISDCFDDMDALMHGLQHLRFQGHEVILFHILHQDELEFPFSGQVRFQGLEGDLDLRTKPHQIRVAYRRAMEGFLAKLEAGCVANGCDYVLMETSRPLATAFTEYLVRRQKVR